MGTEFIGSQENFEEIFKAAADQFDFYILPNSSDIGISNPDQSLENLSIIVERAKKALQNGFSVEFISLKLQYIDFFLRIFYVKKNSKGKVFSTDDKRTFGDVVNSCKQLGFDPQLITKLEDFNVHRINAIHKFLLGDTSEEELKKVALAYSKLGNEIREYVISHVGQKVDVEKDLPSMVGSMVFQTKKL